METEIIKQILLDADVVIHFIKGEQIELLPSIFENDKIILKNVLEELSGKKYSNGMELLKKSPKVKLVDFKADLNIMKEYASLLKYFGKGESACMAFCKFNKNILASSNLRDISKYCKDNGIEYLTTMDFLAEALRAGQLSEIECDQFIISVKSKDSKLPVDTIKEYLCGTRFTVRTVVSKDCLSEFLICYRNQNP